MSEGMFLLLSLLALRSRSLSTGQQIAARATLARWATLMPRA